jgi:hypothetical protein
LLHHHITLEFAEEGGEEFVEAGVPGGLLFSVNVQVVDEVLTEKIEIIRVYLVNAFVER